MKQLLTANVATNLYWLGRYIERIEATLHEVSLAYDKIIDVDKDAGITLYKHFDIELKYDNAVDFLDKAIRGAHGANLYELISYARENAIISRNHIVTEVFGEIIELHGLFQSVSKNAMELDYKFIDQAHSLISEIWGGLSKREHQRYSDYFIRLGKLVEEADFHLRLNREKRLAMLLMDDIDAIAQILIADERVEATQFPEESDKTEMIEIINKKIHNIIVE